MSRTLGYSKNTFLRLPFFPSEGKAGPASLVSPSWNRRSTASPLQQPDESEGRDQYPTRACVAGRRDAHEITTLVSV